MPILPPPPFPKDTSPTPDRVRLLDEWLTSLEAFHPATAGQPWTFYEQLDAYLGPWGMDGYPIAYGRKYCQLFYADRALNANDAGARWVTRTLLRLQVDLQAYVVQRFKTGTLGKITADELRAAAFDTHPKAYTEGGLTMVALLSPNLIRVIATIPRAEFRPASPSFKATVKQVVDTSGIVVPQLIGTLLAIAAGPAHNQSISIVSARDVDTFLGDRVVSLKLAEVRTLVRDGRCDHLDILARLRAGLERATFIDRTANQFAGQVVDDIERRMIYVNHRYLRESVRDRVLRDIFQEFDEGACTWRP